MLLNKISKVSGGMCPHLHTSKSVRDSLATKEKSEDYVISKFGFSDL